MTPLDKNPGLRPIDVGEVLQKIAGKVIVKHAKDDIGTFVGSLKVCAGHEVGCESLIHAKCTVFEEQSTEGALNTFNSVNKKHSYMTLKLYAHQSNSM